MTRSRISFESGLGRGIIWKDGEIMLVRGAGLEWDVNDPTSRRVPFRRSINGYGKLVLHISGTMRDSIPMVALLVPFYLA